MENIKQINNAQDGRFEIFHNEEKAGELTYEWKDDNTFIIDHTEVGPEFGGMGLGKKLVFAAMEYASDNDKKIIPSCSYARNILMKEERAKDLILEQ